MNKKADNRQKYQKNKNYYFKLGSYVLVKAMWFSAAGQNVMVKLQNIYNRPFQVIVSIGKNAYAIQNVKTKQIERMNKYNLILYRMRK